METRITITVNEDGVSQQQSWSTNEIGVTASDMVTAFAGLLVTQTYVPASVIDAMKNFVEENQLWSHESNDCNDDTSAIL